MSASAVSQNAYPFDKLQELDSRVRILGLVRPEDVGENVHAYEGVLLVVALDHLQCLTKQVMYVRLDGLILWQAL